MSFSGIYQIVGPSGKVYIGQMVNFKERFAEHKRTLRKGSHANAHLQNAWNKHGADSFRFEELIYLPIEKLTEYEQLAHIKEEKYNIAICARASTLGLKLSPEAKAKISASLKGNKFALGYKHSAETRAKERAMRLSTKRSAETKAKMSAAGMGNQRWLGRKHSPETIERMRIAQHTRFHGVSN